MSKVRVGAVVAAFGAAAILLPIAAAPAAAQRAVRVGVAAGAAAVEGSGVAPSGAASVEYQTPLRNLAIRAEAGISSRQINGPTRVSAFTINGLLGPSRSHGVAPYVVGGVGEYLQPGLGAHLGVNAGVGLRARLGSVTPYMEMRTHAWSGPGGSTSRMTPLQVGVMF